MSRALGQNVKTVRALRDMSQEELADRMRHLGHKWTDRTPQGVEVGRREVNVDELVALALVLDRSIPELLRPADFLDVGIPGYPMSPDVFDMVARGKLRISPQWKGEGLADPPFRTTRLWPVEEIDQWAREVNEIAAARERGE